MDGGDALREATETERAVHVRRRSELVGKIPVAYSPAVQAEADWCARCASCTSGITIRR